MILIADSGSSKVDWALLAPDGRVQKLRTEGINPAQLTDDEIVAVLRAQIETFAPQVRRAFFFGAGMVGSRISDRMHRLFQSVWPGVRAEFYSDITAAGIALFGKETGIACILGTGSNSCEIENGQLVAHVNAGGFILGDEGSGAWIGRELVRDYIKGLMPDPLSEMFSNDYELSYANIVDHVYRQPRPSYYLANLSLFASRHLDYPYIQDLIRRGFEDFLRRNVLLYPDHMKVPVGFVGSVAMQYEEQLREVCASYGLTVAKILKAPVDALVEYYRNPENSNDKYRL